MVRNLLVIFVLSLFAVACGATTGDGEQTTTTTTPAADGPRPIDFETTLSDGSVFRLSDETKPVYLVFWAEW